MKRHVFRRISIGVLTSVVTTLQLVASTCCSNTNATGVRSVTPKFTIRSQGTNAARRIIGSVGQVNLYDMDQRYGTISVTPEYTRSFDKKEIAKCLFGDKLCDGRILRIQGSRVENRDPNALLADYFYLPTDFSSEVTIRPLIQNFLVDFNFYLGLDNFYQGLYFWLQAPVVWSRWDLGFDECIIESGKNDHDEGYFTVNSIQREVLLNNFSEYAKGKTIGTDFTQTATKRGESTEVIFDFNGLNCAKMCKDSRSKTSVPEIRMALGHNFILEEDYHFGLNFQVSAPTGNNVKPDYLFAVQNGNDNHWEVGGGLSFHYIIKRAEDVENKHFGFYFDANLTHMFKNRQKRCFDLCGKPLSRYMLAAKMGAADTADNLSDNIPLGTLATYQFANEYAPVANLTTFDVDVSVGINADIVAMFNYTGDNWSGDFGYNFWARSCEKIRLRKDCNDFAENTWVLKGDAHMFGYLDSNDGSGSTDLKANDFVALSASMSEATACGGDNFGKLGAITDSAIANGKQNPNIDNAKDAYAGSNNVALDVSRSSSDQIKTSIQPIFIKQDDVNFARTKAMTHKLFGNLTYIWPNKENWKPYLGAGFEIEWATDKGNSSCCNDCNVECEDKCKTECDDVCNQKTTGKCVRCGLSQWGYWIKAGLSFD